MSWLKFAIGLLGGAVLVPALAWVWFVYPASDVSLRWFWWGLAAGLMLGLVPVLAVVAFVLTGD